MEGLKAASISKQSAPAAGVLQRKCSDCKKKEKEKIRLQRTAVRSGPVGDVPPIVHEVLRTPGKPLDRKMREFMELRLGHDFSRVRVHADAKAAESAQAVNALAYTFGNDIIFAEGQYMPSSIISKKLMAHELSHVVQQNGGRRPSKECISMGRTHDLFEVEARTTAERVVSGEFSQFGRFSESSNMLQRQSSSCPPSVSNEIEHRGVCPEIKRDIGELEQFKPSVKIIRKDECYLLRNLGNDSANFGSIPELNEIADVFLQDNTATLNITGYSDCIRKDNNASLNAALRIRRALAVKDYFVKEKKLDEKRIFTNGAPETEYIETNWNAEGRAANRSAVIKIRAAKPPEPQSENKCGPDVSSAVFDAINRTKSTFVVWKKSNIANEACNELDRLVPHYKTPTTIPARIAWDIVELHNQHWIKDEYNRYGCALSAEERKNDECLAKKNGCCPTIQIGKGNCWYPGSVNYVIFGVMCRECFNMGQLRWTQSYMEWLITQYKEKSENYKESKSWANAGYAGWPTTSPKEKPDRSHCTECSIPFPSGTTTRFYVAWRPHSTQQNPTI